MSLRLLAAALALVSVVGTSAAQGDLPAGEVVFEWRNGTGALRTNQANVQIVLETIENGTGVPITTYRPETGFVTLDLVNATLEEMVKRLVGNRFAVSSQQEANGTALRIEQIVILGKGAADREPRIPVPLKEARIIRARDRVTVPREYSGIGAVLGKFPGKEEVWIKPLSEETPAYEVGMRTGDRLLTVNGRPVSSFSRIADITAVIRGPAGTFIRLKFQKPDGTVEERLVLREAIEKTATLQRFGDKNRTGPDRPEE